MDKLVTPLELSRQLDKAGWKHSSVYRYWYLDDVFTLRAGDYYPTKSIPAPTAEELGRVLPDHLETLMPQSGGRWLASGDFNPLGVDKRNFYGDTMTEVLGKLALELLKAGYKLGEKAE